MKKQFLLVLLPLLFVACGDLARNVGNVSNSNQGAQSKTTEFNKTIANAKVAFTPAENKVDALNKESPDADKVKQAVVDVEKELVEIKKIVTDFKGQNPTSQSSEEEAPKEFKAAIGALKEAVKELSDALDAQTPNVDEIETALDKVEKAIATVKASIEKSEQESNEQNPEEAVTINEADYKIKQMHKGDDTSVKHYVIVFIGTNYTSGEQEEFSNYMNLMKNSLFEFEPFASYKNKIDLYAISTVSEKGKPYIKLNESGTGFSDEGGIRVDLLKKKLQELGVSKINVIHTVVRDEVYDWGRGLINNSNRSFSSSKNINSAIHELGHSIGKLGDEYDVRLELANTSRKNQNDVSWASLRDFNGVSVVRSSTRITGDYWVPTSNCIMGSNTGEGIFCEVCKYAIAVKISAAIKDVDITMYDKNGFENVIPYDTYPALVEYLKTH